jgi:hypothetical protein
MKDVAENSDSYYPKKLSSGFGIGWLKKLKEKMKPKGSRHLTYKIEIEENFIFYLVKEFFLLIKIEELKSTSIINQ